MEKNDIVNIYVDPLGKTMLEGKAMLVERINECDGLERWRVKFLDIPEYANCVRNIFANSLFLALLHATTHKVYYQTLLT